MVALDDNWLELTIELRVILRQIRITNDFDDGGRGNFIPGRGESIYSTFLRTIRLLVYPETITQRIPISQRIEGGRNLVDRLFKGKTEEVEVRKQELTNFLKGLKSQLEKYLRDVSLTKIKRIRKRIGPPVENPRQASLESTVTFTSDLRENIRIVNEELRNFEFEKDGIGQLVQEVDLLSLFLSSLNRLVEDVLSPATSLDLIQAQPEDLGPLSGPFISLIKAQTAVYEQRLEQLTDRRVALNAQLRVLEEKMRNLRTGVEEITGERVALFSIVNTILFLLNEVTYTCKECIHFSTTPVEGESILATGTEEEKAREQALIEAGRERAERFAQSNRDQGTTGFCTYRAANFLTAEDRSCLETWGLLGNDFWQASDSSEDGRIDIIQMAKEKMNPRGS